MAFDVPLSDADFLNAHDIDGARRRLEIAQRYAKDSPLQYGLFNKEIAVDLFAGAGGASLGLKWALSRDPDICVNHDPAAIACHALNTPGAKHYIDDVYQVDPIEACAGRPVGIFWMSPTCVHFSCAKGGAPLDAKEARKIRGLAWVGVKWAKLVRPRIIMAENVPGFLTWARLGKSGRVDKNYIDKNGYGEYFKKWVRQLRSLGYEVEWRIISAADYGSPTIRKRIFIIARCDGLPICWPEPTHGPGREFEYRTAAECIDWSLPTVSIFEPKSSARKLGVKRPLADATLRRIAKGIVRFVLATESPYIVEKGQTPFISTLNHSGEELRGQRVDAPKNTITAARDAHALVVPHVTRFRTGSIGEAVDKPLNTITSGQGSKRPAGAAHAMGLVEAQITRVATMVQTGYGERNGQEPRALNLRKPLGTVMAGGVKHAVVEADLAFLNATAPIVLAIDNQSSGDGCAYSPVEPLGTIVKENRHAIAEASFIVQQNRGATGHPVQAPISSLTQTCSQQQVVTAHLTNFYGSNNGTTQGSLEAPLGGITAGGFHQGLVLAELSGDDLEGARRVARFLQGYYTPGKRDPELLVDVGRGTVSVNGRAFQITDIALRMLAVKELSACQGFPPTYRFDPVCEYRTEKGTKFGPLPQSEQVAKIGNSVCPQVAYALANANLYHERLTKSPKRRQKKASVP